MRKLNDSIENIRVIDSRSGFSIVINYGDGNTQKWFLDDEYYKDDLVNVFKELGFNSEHEIDNREKK